MNEFLTEKQKLLYFEFKEFVERNVICHANEWEREEAIPRKFIDISAKAGYLGVTIPVKYGGKDWDYTTYGLLNEAVGYVSISLSSIFNVHTMVSQTILKWGTEEQKQKWLPKMVTGEIIGAFALTESNAGSDIRKIETEFSCKSNKLVLNGKKKWITFGEIADVFLVFGKLHGKDVACLIERETQGFNVTPIKDMLGFKAAHLASLEFNNCEISKENMIASPGFAFSHIAPYALEFGRISVAFGALGILRSCIEACSSYSLERRTFDRKLIDHHSICSMITDMGIDLKAARMLCLNACKVKEQKHFDGTENVMIAKYFASRAAVKHVSNAVQIMGALGCNENFAVARHFRDSKILEIIEGSNQILQMLLGKNFARKNRRKMINKK